MSLIVNNPLVSICCMTYNHEKFIRQCLDGFVMQQTNFNFEILVHEDASTDNTTKILKEYEIKYPHLFRCVYQKVNQFAIQNTLINILFPMAKGKYIAMCEGDDYWTDSLKLQKQVDYLERHTNCVGCFSDTSVINENGIVLHDAILDFFKREVSIAEVGHFWMPTVSICFRSNHLAPIIECKKIKQVNNGDMFLYYLLSQFGNFGFVQTSPSCYRQHSGGIWSSVKIIDRYQKNLDSDYIILDELMPQNKQFVLPRLKTNYAWQLDYYKTRGQISSAIHFYKRNVSELTKRNHFGLVIYLTTQLFYIFGLRIAGKTKRIFQ